MRRRSPALAAGRSTCYAVGVSSNSVGRARGGHLHVTELDLRDVRCIARAQIDFLHPDRPDSTSLEFPNLNVLVGLNGGGKSTLLKAVILAMMGRELESTDRSWRQTWPRLGGESDCSSRVGVLFHSSDLPEAPETGPDTHLGQRGTIIRRSDASLTARAPAVADGSGRLRSPTYFMVGYGASREVARPRSADSDPDPQGGQYPATLGRVTNLLFGGPPLTPLESWLDERHPRFEEVARLVDDLLPVETRFQGHSEAGRFLFVNRGVAVPRGALSDGLQSYLAWVSDLALRLLEVTPPGSSLRSTKGVVLVDEIDQRMHPRWQQSVLARLAGTLPNLQFLLTSHSPLIAGGLRAENLILLEVDPDAPGSGATRARRLSEDVYGATADQVLTSSYFDLEMSRSGSFRSVLRTLSLAARDGDVESALEHMRRTAATGRPGHPDSVEDEAPSERRPLKPEADTDDAWYEETEGGQSEDAAPDAKGDA